MKPHTLANAIELVRTGKLALSTLGVLDFRSMPRVPRAKELLTEILPDLTPKAVENMEDYYWMEDTTVKGNFKLPKNLKTISLSYLLKLKEQENFKP